MINSITFYCYVLPKHHLELQTDASNVDPTKSKKYIVKPQAAAAGKAIYVRTSEEVVTWKNSKPFVVQPYLENP